MLGSYVPHKFIVFFRIDECKTRQCSKQRYNKFIRKEIVYLRLLKFKSVNFLLTKDYVSRRLVAPQVTLTNGWSSWYLVFDAKTGQNVPNWSGYNPNRLENISSEITKKKMESQMVLISTISHRRWNLQPKPDVLELFC